MSEQSLISRNPLELRKNVIRPGYEDEGLMDEPDTFEQNIEVAREIATKVDAKESERAAVIGGIALIGEAYKALESEFLLPYVEDEINWKKYKMLGEPDAYFSRMTDKAIFIATQADSFNEPFGTYDIEKRWHIAREIAVDEVTQLEDDLTHIYATGLTKEQQARQVAVDSFVRTLRRRA